MAEIVLGNGDSVSRLLQVIAKDVGLVGMRWGGTGGADVRLVMVELYNTRLVRDSLWSGLHELCQMPELKELPESVQAKIMAIILTARANAELRIKQ